MKSLLTSILIVGCFLVAGCIPTATKHPLADGYSIETINHFLAVEPGGGREFHYRSPRGGQKLVWKYVPGTVVVNKGTAIFIGDWQDPEEIEGYAYFAVKENGPVVRIGKPVLTHAAQKNGAQPEGYFKKYVEGELHTSDQKVQFEFGAHGVNQPDFSVDLTWDEISEIVNTIVKTGKPHKDKLNGITYLE